MYSSKNQDRIKSIYRMMLEIINGNLTYRITLSGNDKQFDELAGLLNTIAMKMIDADYQNPYTSHTIQTLGDLNPSEVIMYKVQEYIMNHLDEPLPSAKELSDRFGTNEFTLKESFRTVLQTSIYQFYNDERLKKAYTLIEQSAIPLKQIAFICGFNNYTNFFKAFKKKYTFSPSNLERKQQISE